MQFASKAFLNSGLEAFGDIELTELPVHELISTIAEAALDSARGRVDGSAEPRHVFARGPPLDATRGVASIGGGRGASTAQAQWIPSPDPPFSSPQRSRRSRTSSTPERDVVMETEGVLEDGVRMKLSEVNGVQEKGSVDQEVRRRSGEAEIGGEFLEDGQE